MKEITVIAKDRLGLLADVCDKLGSERVNIDSIAAEAANGTAVIRLTVDHAARAKEVLEKASFQVTEPGMLVVRLADRAGELAKISRELAAGQVDVRNVRILSKENGTTVLGMEVNNHETAKAVLKRYA